MEIKGNHTLNGGSGPRMDAVLDRGNLTTSQSLLWMGQKLHPETPLYNMAVAFRIGGPIDPQRFRNAWHRYADSCDALRLAVVEENGVPLQRPRDTAPSLEIIDLSNLDDPDNACSLLMAQRCRKVFDLATDLTDSALIKLADDRWVWYLNQHHLVTDGWSSSIVYRGVEKAYREPDSDVHTQPFDDYAKFERKHRQSRLFEKALRYWNERASDIPPPITFYGRQPTGAGTRTDRVRRRLGVERSESLKGLAERMSRNALSQHVGRFNLLMSVLAAYLFRVSGQTRLNIGAPAHNRPTAAFKQTAGVFIEVLPFRVDVEEEDTLRSLFEKVSHETSNFLRHAHPGSSQARLTRSFNVVLNYINVTIPPFAGYSVETEWIHCDHGDSSHHLRVQVHDFDDTGEFVLGFDFSREVFDETEQQEAATHFIHLIDELVRDPDRRIAEASLLDEDERSRMINVANGPAKDVPRQTVCELFIHEVADNPNRVLLMDGDRSLTSEQVLRAARTVAADLCEAGVGIGDRVGLYMTRSADLVVGMLGVMFAGAAYVPVDPADPPARSEFVFKDADVGSILVSDIGSGRVPIDNRNIVVVDPLADSDHDGGELPRPRELAYIIYTSGSTGRPKGVAVSHGALASYVKWAASQYASDRSPLVFPFFTSPSFDMTITSLFVPLLTGGSIVIFRPEGEGPDISLRSVLADERVNTIKLTPTHLSLVQDMRVPADRVRQLIFGGENLRRDTAEAARTVFGPEVVIYNEYGPTEATVGCIVHKYDEHKDHETSVPIGRPISGSRAYLLDKGLNPIPQGTIGELFLGGPGLAEGYWDRDDITAERFIPDPFRPGERMYRTGDLARIRPDGSLVYLGRDDDQIKLHGFRVERGEVEAALTDHPDVVECAVVLTGTSRHDLQTQYCSRCGLSSEYPQTTFDEEGVCNTCRSFDGYRDRAMEFFSSMDELQQLLESESKRKTGKYDCLALFSGGKDSTYTLCRLVEMGRSVLAFTLDNGFISEKAKENIDRLVAHLGVDHVYGTTPAMNQIFAESLKRHANVCNGCFKTIYTLAMKTAHDHGIPVIVTGLSRGQLFETRLTGELFVGESVDVDAIEETILHARKAYHRLDDEVARLIDFEEARGDEIFRQIKFVDFYRYCDVGLDEVMSFLESRVPWVRPDDTGRSTNCLINEAGIFVHQKERGYHNYAWPYAWDVRMGHKTRTDALDELQDDIDVSRVQQMLDQVGYSVDSLHATRERLTAYYAAPYSIAVSELRDHLRQRLPEFMIPTAFVRLDEVPRSPSGKIDLKALPVPSEERPSVSTAFVEPRSDKERILCRIWREVLRIDRVGVHDNFFDLGGDSIMAIQIVTRAREAGLELSASTLFEHQTVAEIISDVSANVSIAPDQDKVTGEAPLAPMQRYLFDAAGEAVNEWNHSMLLEGPTEIDEESLRKAVAAVVGHHDALRLRFRKVDGDWRQFHDGIATGTELQIVDLSPFSSREQDAYIAKREAETHTTIDITRGPILTVVVFRLGDSRPDRVLIVIHHLVVDGVSWSHLLADLSTAYLSIRSGSQIVFPSKTCSFKQWLEELHRQRIVVPTTQASAEQHRSERNGGSSGSGDAEIDRVSSERTVTVTIDEKKTAALLTDLRGKLRVGFHEALASVIGRECARTFNLPTVRLDVEAHGRDLLPHVDVTRTVGWFSTTFPVVVYTDPDTDLLALLKQTKSEMNRVASRSLEYTLASLGRPAAPEDGEDRAEVLFNYLGRFDDVVGSNLLFKPSRELRLWRSQQATRPYPLEVAAYTYRDRLVIDIAYSARLHDAQAIENMAHGIERGLSDCAALVRADVEVEATPFELANLDQKRLQQLRSALDRIDGADQQ